MPTSIETESRIIQRFDQVGDKSVAELAGESDFELRAILRFFGQPQPGAQLLDVGCGKGKFVPTLTQAGFSVTGVEPSAALIRSAQSLHPHTRLIQASATALPFANEVFDYVMCIETLEHVPDIDQAISEMVRVLKPGGRLIIIDKNISSLHPVHFAPTAIWKRVLEDTNRWMYPKDFPFREQYFKPQSLRRLIAQHCSHVNIEFLRFEPEVKARTQPKRWLWLAHQGLTQFIYRLVPQLSFYVAWQATK